MSEPKTADAKLDVRIATNAADIRRVQEFRFRVLVEETGQTPPGIDAEARLVRDPTDERSLHLYVVAGTDIVGTVRLSLLKSVLLAPKLIEACRIESFKTFAGDRLSVTSPLVVAHAHRHSTVPAVLLGAAYKIARAQGSRFDFCLVPPALVQLYEMLGYRRYTDNIDKDDGGYRVPLVLVMDDARHLGEVKSPFARLAVGFANGNEAALWLRKQFPQAERAEERKMDEQRFWSFLTDKLHQTPLHGIPLLNGLTFQEASRFLKVGTVLKAKTGDQVIRKGESGNEMYIVLRGRLRVTIGGNFIAEVARGDLFGEMAFLSEMPRTADVAVAEDAELLVLTQPQMRRAIQAMPDVSAKVLFNLALVLTAKLRTGTEKLVLALGAEALADAVTSGRVDTDAALPEGSAEDPFAGMTIEGVASK